MSYRLVFAVIVVSVAAPAQVQTALLPAAKDNTLYQHFSGALSNGSGQGLFVGKTSGGSDRRALIAFDVAGNLPPGSSIQSAELRLNMDMTIAGIVNVSLHTASQDWGEGASSAGGGGFANGGGGGAPAQQGDATWLHSFFNTTSWTTPGGDFNGTPSATTPVNQGGTYAWSSAQMVSDVQGWLNTPSTNFGWLLKGPNLVTPEAKRFRSREHIWTVYRPLLVVTFTAPAGVAVVSSGYGCPVSFGGATEFSMTLSGPPTIGTSFNVVAANGHPGGFVAFYLASGMSASPIILPGSSACPVWLDVASALAQIATGGSPIGPLPLDATGGFSLPINVPNVPAIIGAEFSAQATSTGTSGVVTSNAIWLRIG